MKKISMGIVLLLFIGLLSMSYFRSLGKEISIFKKEVPYQINNDQSPFLLIGHGGGSLEVGRGKYATVTNAREAFEQNYDKGLRLFEVDLVYTKDNEIVARHDWKSYLYKNFLGQTDPVKDDRALSFDEVMGLPIYNNYHTIDWKGLLTFLETHEDASLIIDIKPGNSSNVKQVYEDIVKQAVLEKKETLLQRVIPQFYQLDQYQILRKIYNFPQLIFTLYLAYDVENNEIVNLLNNHPSIYALTLSEEDYERRRDLVDKAQQSNKKIFIHTIDSLEKVTHYSKEGVDGLYTNHIREEAPGSWVNILTNETIKKKD